MSDATPAQPIVVVALWRGGHVTFGRVVSSNARRVIVDLTGILVGFSRRSGRALDPAARGYRMQMYLAVTSRSSILRAT